MAITYLESQNCRARTLLAALLSTLTPLLALPAHAQKTISYYTDNVVERIDKVLACKDGAEDPLSLGCRNANAAHRMDIRLASRYQESMAVEKWQAKESDKRRFLVLRALENARNSLMNVACVNLTSGQTPTNPISKTSLKVALEERFIEPLAGQSGKFKATARGEEMLRAQQMSSKSGYFCPTSLQFDANFKIVEYQDLTAQNKGKKSEAGKVVKTMAIATVEMNLTNTSSSVWYAKKVFPIALPATGLAKGRYLIVQHVDSDAVASSGGIVSLDGKTLSDFKVEQLIEKSYK